MTIISIAGARVDWPLQTIREKQLRELLAAPEAEYEVWQHTTVGPDIRIVGMADLRFGREFTRKKR